MTVDTDEMAGLRRDHDALTQRVSDLEEQVAVLVESADDMEEWRLRVQTALASWGEVIAAFGG